MLESIPLEAELFVSLVVGLEVKEDLDQRERHFRCLLFRLMKDGR